MKPWERKLKDFVRDLASEYYLKKQAECERLHNDLVKVIEGHEATVQNTLYVLKMLEFELLMDKYVQIFKKGKKLKKKAVE